MWVEEHEISNQKTNHDKSKELWKKPGVEKLLMPWFTLKEYLTSLTSLRLVMKMRKNSFTKQFSQRLVVENNRGLEFSRPRGLELVNWTRVKYWLIVEKERGLWLEFWSNGVTRTAERVEKYFCFGALGETVEKHCLLLLYVACKL